VSSSTVDLFSLSKCKLLGENGEVVIAGDLWKTRTIVFIFLRHFACIACRAHAVQVWAHRAHYEKNNAKIVFVSNGPAMFITGFKEELSLSGAPVFTDPTLESFRACGFMRGFFRALSPRSLLNSASLYKEGHRQGAKTLESGDLWQLGGVVVVKPGNEVAFHFISEATGEFPTDDEMITGS
jgi:peroxiredoxin